MDIGKEVSSNIWNVASAASSLEWHLILLEELFLYRGEGHPVSSVRVCIEKHLRKTLLYHTISEAVYRFWFTVHSWKTCRSLWVLPFTLVTCLLSWLTQYLFSSFLTSPMTLPLGRTEKKWKEKKINVEVLKHVWVSAARIT